MGLFCPNCFKYLGPNAENFCEDCGEKINDHAPFPDRGKPVWEKPVNLEGHPVGRPVFSQGLILVVCKRGRFTGGLTAMDVNGQIRWEVAFNEIPVDSPLVDEDRVYVCTAGLGEGGSVLCFNINTQNPQGELIWQQNRSEVITANIDGKAAIQERRLYVPCRDGTILCLDAFKGEPVPGWRVNVERDLHWLILSNQNLVAICRERGQIYLINPVNGRHEGPVISLNTKLSCEPLLSKDMLLYVGTDDGRMLRVDLKQRSSQEIAHGLKKVIAPPIAINGLIIAGAHDHHVYAWKEDGIPAWQSRFESEHAISSSPAAVEDLAAIGANDGKIYGIDLDSGEKYWSFDTGIANGVMRHVLYHDQVFYVGVYPCNGENGYMYAVPWHLGEYEVLAKKQRQKNNLQKAADLYALSSQYARVKEDKFAFGEEASQCWLRSGNPQYAAAFWESLAFDDRAVGYWREAAELMRGIDNIKAAEYFYRASRVYWRLGQPADDKKCAEDAARLAKWPSLRLSDFNNPVKRMGESRPLSIRMENIGYNKAENFHFNVGGSLLEPISFDYCGTLAAENHFDIQFMITPTRVEDNVKIEVSYHAAGRSLPFTTVLDVPIRATKVMRVNLGDMVKGEVKIVNESGDEMDIEAGDSVNSKIEIVNKSSQG